MPIYTVSYNPNNISGLQLWVDASDVSTMSLTGIGSVTASVISIKDKISGKVLSSSGTKFPLYYFNKVDKIVLLVHKYNNYN